MINTLWNIAEFLGVISLIVFEISFLIGILPIGKKLLK